MNTEDLDLSIAPNPAPVDDWITSKCHRMIHDARFALDTYRFDIYANTVYEFAWHEYCDWYLELTKPCSGTKTQTCQRALQPSAHCYRYLKPCCGWPIPSCRLLLKPFGKVLPSGLITAQQSASIMLQAFPTPEDMPINEAAEAQTEWLKAVITGIRTIRGETNIKPSQDIPLLLQGDAADKDNAAQAENMLGRLANVTSIQWLDEDDEAPLNALSLVDDLKVMVPLAGIIDLEAERGRIGKEVERAQQELEKIEKKLNNEAFVAKAPEAIVCKDRERAADLQTTLQQKQLESLTSAQEPLN